MSGLYGRIFQVYLGASRVKDRHKIGEDGG